MPAVLKRLTAVALLLGAAGLVWRHVASRPLPQLAPAESARVFGAFHVHSSSSHDSSVTLESIAGAAQEQGLDFVVVTDHNEQLAAAVSIGNVTVLSYAELSTPYGHLVQLGAGYVLPPEQRGTVGVHQAIRALGGIPVIAHPSDRKRPWEGPLDGAGGLEITNLAASARRRAGPVFVGAAPALAVWRSHPLLGLAQLYDRDDQALRLWDANGDPRFIGLCAADAHGRIDLRVNLSAWELAVDTPLPEAVGPRSAALLEAIGAGRFYCVASSFGRPRFELYLRRVDGSRAHAGDTVALSAAQEIVVEGPQAAQPVTLVLLRNGEPVVRSRGDELRYASPAAGTYRVEVHAQLPGVLWGERTVPVIYSSRIRVTPDTSATAP